MSANHVLLWLSAVRHGSWNQFLGAFARLMAADGGPANANGNGQPTRHRFPPHQELRLNLQRLGHADFGTQESGERWRIAPPTLAVSRKADGWLAVLAGARWPRLLEELQGRGRSSPVFEAIDQPNAPDVLRLQAGDITEFNVIAQACGLYVQINAPLAILSTIPEVRDHLPQETFHIPHGDWQIARFAATSGIWERCEAGDWLERRTALYRFQFRHQRRYALWALRRLRAITNPQVGKYLVLRRYRKSVLQYDADRQRLVVPKTYRPPVLVDRALTLASGLLPSTCPDGLLEYGCIDHVLAITAARLLGQTLR